MDCQLKKATTALQQFFVASRKITFWKKSKTMENKLQYFYIFPTFNNEICLNKSCSSHSAPIQLY